MSGPAERHCRICHVVPKSAQRAGLRELMQNFSAQDVHRLLDYSTLMDALDEAHRGPMPIVERQLLEQGQDGMIVWSAWLPDQAMGVKVMTLYPQNRSQPTVQGLFTLFDGHGGAPLAMIDGAALTVRKTAADSGLAARYLAPVDARVLLMVGAGAMAPHLIAAHRAARPSIERVLVWNRTTTRAEKLVAELVDIDISMAPDLPAAVGQAHVISCATRSMEP
ncbi:MAG TPA: hypothetical protein ENI69_01505, partial [Rhodospirillales bacterium]|nr:hypothetical protein [Rhodospirillales bacterium]